MIDALMSEWSEAARQWTPIALDATIKASIVLAAAWTHGWVDASALGR